MDGFYNILYIFLDSFPKNPVATRIPQDDGLESILYNDRKILPHRLSNQSAFHITRSKHRALNRVKLVALIFCVQQNDRTKSVFSTAKLGELKYY